MWYVIWYNHLLSTAGGRRNLGPKSGWPALGPSPECLLQVLGTEEKYALVDEDNATDMG